MRRRRTTVQLAAFLVAVGMLAAACGSSKKTATATTVGGVTTTGQATTTTAAPQGGDLVLGAEQEPDCVDWIATCAQSSWGIYTMGSQTMPRPYDVDSKGNFVPTILLTEAPTLESSPVQKVTYKLNPKAVWDDGQPITATDFKYTVDQICGNTAAAPSADCTAGKDILSTIGYKDIAKVDDTDPKTVVVTFKTGKTYGDWQDLFAQGALFPSHLLQGKDRDALTKDGYTFSGGPWKIDHWTKGAEVKLVPNKNYWGKVPNLNSVTFKFLADQAAELEAYKTGQVAAIYPQVSPDLPALKTLADTKFDTITGLSYEAFWFNAAAEPFTDVAVRKAFGFAVDRDIIVQQLFGQVQPDIKPINAFMTPANATFYGSEPFKNFKLDLKQVDTILTGAGWAKGADGVYAKAGKKLEITIKSTAGNKRRELTEQLLQSQLKDAGITLVIANEKASVLFNDTLVKGNYQLSLYAQVPGSSDPGLCTVFCSDQIPSAANGNAGQNNSRINDPAVDKAFKDLDSAFDPGKRKDLSDQGQKALADFVAGLPLDPFPDTVIYNTAKIGGPVGHNVYIGPFFNMNEWFLKK